MQSVFAPRGPVVGTQKAHAGVGQRVLGVLGALRVAARVAEQAGAVGAQHLLEGPCPGPDFLGRWFEWLGGHAARPHA